jgi:hypothetical protein
MKIFVILCLFVGVLTDLKAQPITPYIAIIKTTSGKKKGILYQADKNLFVIDAKDELLRIKPSEIREVTIRKAKKQYEIKNFIKSDSSDNNRHLNSNSNQLNENDFSLEKEIGRGLNFLIVNGIVNGFAAPIHAINPNVVRLKFTSKAENKSQVEYLSYYSIFNQTHPQFNVLQPLK